MIWMHEGNGHETRLYRISDEGRLVVVTLMQLPRSNETVEVVTVYDEVKGE